MNMERKKSNRHKYIPNSINLFEETNDDSTQAASHPDCFRTRFPPLQQKPSPHNIELERQRQAMLDKRYEIEQRTLASASRGVGLLHDSEKMGIAAAEELVCQHETLDKTNNRLDDINPNLDISGKHLKGINSIFYSLKTFITGNSVERLKRQNTKSVRCENSSRRLDITLDKLSERCETDSYSNHPSTRLRDFDQQEQKSASQIVDDKLEASLNDMHQIITRLKTLGEAIGEEIDDQNKLIDTIHDKAENAGIKIDKQNKTINKLLGN